jgi:hypothetical protein
MAVVDSLYSGYGEMQGGSLGDYLCTRDMAKVLLLHVDANLRRVTLPA